MCGTTWRPPPPGRRDAWRRWKRKVWAGAERAGWAARGVATWGPGTGVLGEGQPGGFQNLACKGLGKAPRGLSARDLSGLGQELGGHGPGPQHSNTHHVLPQRPARRCPQAQDAAMSASACRHDSLPLQKPGKPPGKHATRDSWFPVSPLRTLPGPRGPASERCFLPHTGTQHDA